MSMTPEELAQVVGKLTGREDLSELVTSGGLEAEDVVPLLAGMFDGILRTLAQPVAKFRTVSGPFRGKKFYSARFNITTARGELVTVVIEAPDA